MSVEQRYNLYGYRFAFGTNVPRAAELFSDLYTGRADSADPSTPPKSFYALSHRVGARGEEQWTIDTPGIHTQVKPTFGDCMAGVESAIAGDFCREDSGHHVIHGGVVYGDKGDILISGRSGAGKTTLSLALSTRGFDVGGDDLAVLDPSNDLVEPVPRCFHIDERSADLLAEVGLPLPQEALRDQFVTPGRLGVVRPAPARIRFAFLLEGERASVPRLAPMTQAQMASAMLKQTGRGRFSDIEGVQAMARLIGPCSCYRVWPGKLGPTVDAVVDVVTQTPGMLP